MNTFFFFAAVGALSTVIDIIVLKLLLVAGVNLYAATALGFLAGLTNGYLLNSRFVFAKKSTVTAYSRYFLVSAGGLVLTEFIIHILAVQLALMSPIEAKLVAVFFVFFWNFGLCKRWVFR